MENFGRLLRLKWHFRESENFSEFPAFKPPSKFNPRNKDVAIEVYLSKLEDEIMKISAEENNYSNISREEKVALNNLKSDRTIVIKEADKGSGVVFWGREDYIKKQKVSLGILLCMQNLKMILRRICRESLIILLILLGSEGILMIRL